MDQLMGKKGRIKQVIAGFALTLFFTAWLRSSPDQRHQQPDCAFRRSRSPDLTSVWPCGTDSIPTGNIEMLAGDLRGFSKAGLAPAELARMEGTIAAGAP